jgi:hypothetical protein
MVVKTQNEAKWYYGSLEVLRINSVAATSNVCSVVAATALLPIKPTIAKRAYRRVHTKNRDRPRGFLSVRPERS